MALINDRINENSEKCFKCAFNIMRSKLKNKIDHNSVLYEEAEIAVEGILKISCNLCPFKSDFEKVYGMTPYEYFLQYEVMAKK